MTMDLITSKQTSKQTNKQTSKIHTLGHILQDRECRMAGKLVSESIVNYIKDQTRGNISRTRRNMESFKIFECHKNSSNPW